MGYGLFQTATGGAIPTPPTIIWYEVTRVQALALIAANTVVKGAGYLITDKSIVLYGDDENAFKLEGSLIVNSTTQDVVHYDIVNDLIVYRRDRNNNQVSCIGGISTFPFNNPLCWGNIVSGKVAVSAPTSPYVFNDNYIQASDTASSVISGNTRGISGNIFNVGRLILTGNQRNLQNNNFEVNGDLQIVKAPIDINSNDVKLTNSFIFDNTAGFVTQFGMTRNIISGSNVTVDTTTESFGFNYCNINCNDLTVRITGQSLEGKCYHGNFDYTLTTYSALDQPTTAEESEFCFTGQNFSLGTKLCFVASSVINTSGPTSILSVINNNSFKDASIYVWSDVTGGIEYATGINELQRSDNKNIKLWNRSSADKYIVFEKENGLPFYTGQFFSETEDVLCLRQNEYVEFQLCKVINGSPIAFPFYQLIRPSLQKPKTIGTFEGSVGVVRFRTVQQGGGGVTISNPSLADPFTKGLMSISAGGIAVKLSYSDSNAGAFPLQSLSSNYQSCFIKIRAKPLAAVDTNINAYLGYVSGILSTTGEGVTGISISNGIVSTVSLENGNPSVIANILPLASIPNDVNWHEYSTIITSSRIIFIYDGKIIQVTSNKPATAFTFARGVLIQRIGAASAYSLLIENIVYGDL
jgi:hypothetical protein